MNSRISFTSISTSKKVCIAIYQTRHAEDYEIPHFKTNFARKTIRATGPMKWNLTEKTCQRNKNYKAF